MKTNHSGAARITIMKARALMHHAITLAYAKGASDCQEARLLNEAQFVEFKLETIRTILQAH